MIAGYDGIITRDVRMHLDAAHVLKDLPKFAIVIVQLAQAKKAVYLAAFEEALRRTPLVPQPGQAALLFDLDQDYGEAWMYLERFGC